MGLTDLVVLLFTACNSLRVLAYVPQIMRIARDDAGAVAISYATWVLFGLSHLTTVAYAAIVAQDWRMALVFVANTTACVIILALTFMKRAQLKRQPTVDATQDLNCV